MEVQYSSNDMEVKNREASLTSSENEADDEICGSFDVVISSQNDPSVKVSARATCALLDNKNAILYSLTTFSILLQSFIFTHICEDLTEIPVGLHLTPTGLIKKWDLFRPELSEIQRNGSISWMIGRINSLLQSAVLKAELTRLHDGCEPINIPLKSFKAGLYCQEYDGEERPHSHVKHQSFCKDALLLEVDTKTKFEHLKSLRNVTVGENSWQLIEVERYPEKDSIEEGAQRKDFFQAGTKRVRKEETWYAQSRTVKPLRPKGSGSYNNGRFQIAYQNINCDIAQERDEPIIDLGLPVYKLKKLAGSLSLVGMLTKMVEGDVNTGYRSTCLIVDETIKAFEQELDCDLTIYGDGQDVNPLLAIDSSSS